MSTIQLSKNLFSTIDEADFDLVRKHKWYPNPVSGKIYARGNIDGKRVYMHRIIVGATDPKIHVDHINGDTLDNRRSNLRMCSKSQNGCNRGKNKNSTSGFKGVTFCKSRKKFVAQIKKNWKRYALGYFNTAHEAAIAYDSKAKELHGEFAKLNFKENP